MSAQTAAEKEFDEKYPHLKTLPLVHVDVVEFNETKNPSEFGVRSKNTSLFKAFNKALAEKSCTGRSYDAKYQYKEGWVDLDEDTDCGDIGDDPRFCLHLNEPAKAFSASAFLKQADSDAPTFKNLGGGLNHAFQKIRTPQSEALLKLRKVLAPAPAASRFIIILPTGCGKTTVLSLSPFMLDASKVLVILPDLTIRDQVHGELTNLYSDKHPIGKVGKVNVTVERFSAGRGSMTIPSADMITTNIQALVKREPRPPEGEPRPPEGGDAADDPNQDGGDATGLKHTAQQLLNAHKPDLVIIDEGHHFPASSWEHLSKKALEYNGTCKFVLLTATPQRGDGATYGIPKVMTPGKEFFYLYSRRDAIANKYLKSIHGHPIVPKFTKPTAQSRYEEKPYILSMIQPAVAKLRGIRNACDNAPIRMLITARTNAAANAIMKIFNETSKKERWDLHAEAITLSSTKADDGKAITLRKNFECDRGEEDKSMGIPLIDVGVQCKMLGEGYDNPWIAISVFAHPAKSVGRLSQVHGRAVRIPNPTKLNVSDFPLAQQSHLFYPDETNPRTQEREADAVFQEYMACKDESTDSLFATLVFKTLKSAHQLLGGKETDEMVAALKDNFVEYHALYEEKRLKWKEVPAEVVAEVIYKDLIDKSGPFKPEISYRIVDFGCGIDGLFEHKLADLVAQRDGKGCVHTLAVDVGDVGLGEQSWPKVLTKAGEKPRNGIDDDHTTFQCESIAGDYTKDIMYNTKLNSGYFDAGVFCLAIMAADGLSRALLVASKIVKPEGPIFIVLDTWKFGFHGYATKLNDMNTKLEEWKAEFTKQTSFSVQSHTIRGNPRFVYLTILNVNHSQVDGLEEKLQQISLKDLHVSPEKPVADILSTPGSKAKGVAVVPETPGTDISIKRSLDYKSGGDQAVGGTGPSKMPRSE